MFFLLSISPVLFPQGISPKVEFSTTSIIEECDVKPGQPAMSVSLGAFVIAIILQLVCAPFQKLVHCLAAYIGAWLLKWSHDASSHYAVEQSNYL